MTALPAPPKGVHVARPGCPEWGELAEWRHTGEPGAARFVLRFFAPADGPATVTVTTGPARMPVEGVTDPAELRAIAWMALDAARWLAAMNASELPADPDPQLTFEGLAATA